MEDLRKYGIIPEKGRNYENIAYVMALIYNICEKKIANILAKYNLSTAQYNVLLAVRFQKEGKGLSQVEIGSHLIVTPSGITKIINKLFEQGLLDVSQNKENRRENLVNITKKGSDLIDDIWPIYDNAIKDMINFIPDEKQKELENILENWFKKLQEEK